MVFLYVNYIDLNNVELYISHKRLENAYDLFNPLNIILDSKSRDIAEYIKKILRGSCDARALFNLKSFFNDNKTISTDSPAVQNLLKKYDVTLQTTQNKPQ